VIPVVALVARLESLRPSRTPASTPTAIAVLKVVLAVAGVAIVLLVGFTPVWSWVLGLFLLVVAVGLVPKRAREIEAHSPHQNQNNLF